MSQKSEMNRKLSVLTGWQIRQARGLDGSTQYAFAAKVSAHCGELICRSEVQRLEQGVVGRAKMQRVAQLVSLYVAYQGIEFDIVGDVIRVRPNPTSSMAL
jgi:hypothetical protein